MSKFDGIASGDRVRITFEGAYVGGNIVLLDDARGQKTEFLDSEVKAATFKVEKIEAPLAVGDDIWPKNRTGVATRRVLATFELGGEPWVVFNPFFGGGTPVSQLARDFERAPR